MSDKIKIIIADDHQIFREGLIFVLTEVANFEVIAEVENGSKFLKVLNTKKPDIVLMDIEMPELNGIQATELALKKYPNLKIIALTSYFDEIYYYKMVKAGVMGFIVKKSGKEELEKAIYAVAKGNNYFSQELLRKIIYKIGNDGISSLVENKLEITKREKEVLYLISQGFSNKEIGEKLFISPKTVDNHRTSLLSKTGSKNTASLVFFAIKNKIIKIN